MENKARWHEIAIVVCTLCSAIQALAQQGASVRGPGKALSGATVSVTWTGPKNKYDKIGIVAAGAPDKQRPLKSEYVRTSPTKIKLPEPPGKYEIRYLAGDSGSTLAKTGLTITAAHATVKGPGKALSGATIAVTWTGPKNEYDKIGIYGRPRDLRRQPARGDSEAAARRNQSACQHRRIRNRRFQARQDLQAVVRARRRRLFRSARRGRPEQSALTCDASRFRGARFAKAGRGQRVCRGRAYRGHARHLYREAQSWQRQLAVGHGAREGNKLREILTEIIHD